MDRPSPHVHVCADPAAVAQAGARLWVDSVRHALAARGAVLDLEIGGKTTSAILKDSQHNVVRGDTLHVDFLRVRLDVAIHAVVPLEKGSAALPG